MDSYKATMGLETFNIELDNQPPIYLPGKHVAGHVNLVTKAPLHFQIILIHCQGEANTFRTKTKIKDNMPSSVNYKGHDVIFSDETTLLTGPQTAASADDPQPMELNAGTYKLPFYFTLPPSCPGSFEGTFGSIRYYLKASINNPSGNVMHMVKRPFTVINLTDLNENKENTRRWSTNAVVPLPKNSFVACKASTKKRAYVPGEMVSLKFELNNTHSNKVINALNCQLQQTITYFGWKDNRETVRNWEENRIVTQLTKKAKFPAHKATTLQWDLFKMPPVSPTLTPEDSRLINVQYGLVFTTTDLEPTLTLYLPIVIGTIPLESAFDSLKVKRDQCLGAASNGNVPVALPLVPLTENHKTLPVPHYLPNVFGSLDIRDQHDGVLLGTPLPFVPLCVSYDWTPIADEMAARMAQEAALREAENKKEKRTVKKSGRKQQEYVINGNAPETLASAPPSQALSSSSSEKRKTLFSSRKTKSTKSPPPPPLPPTINSLDKATQTDYEDTDYDTDAHSADEL